MKNLLLFLGLFLTFSLTTVSCAGEEAKDANQEEVNDETSSCCAGEKCDPTKCKKDGKCDPAKCKKDGKTCDKEGKCSEGKCADKCGEGKCADKCGHGDSSDSTSKCGEDHTEGSKC